MFLYWWIALAAFLEMQKLAMAECPLDLSGSNFTLAASICSNQDDRGKCCRYINAFIAVAVTRYANRTGNLGVPSELSAICLKSVSETLELYGIQPNATVFCGLGTKIPVTYQCKGRTTVPEMLLSPNFKNVTQNCKGPLSLEVSCKKCLNAGIVYLHHLVGADGNMTLSTCRDATFVSIASQGDNVSAFDMASCFFGVQGLSIFPVINSEPSSPLLAPKPSVGPISAASPGHGLVVIPLKEHRNPYHLTLVPGIGIAVTGAAVLLLVVLILLIRRKNRELKGSESDSPNGTSWKSFPQPNRKSQEGPSSMFRRFSYKETKKATGNFGTVIGRGGFGTVYKAQFKDGFVAAVKRMDKVSEQGEDEFCREMELLGRLHHRHLVSLRGFCVEKHERFLMYEYMENGSLKDHLHSPGKTPLGWQTRIQIAIDVANALRDLHGILSKAPFLGWVVRPKFHVRDVSLRTSADRFLTDCLLLLPLDFQPSPGIPVTKLSQEYLHFYCDPPLCHRDIKSSNILLDENFVAKVADFGLAHASRSGSISFEPVNTDIRGTPGYMDPEYVVTQELTEKSDVYSYGVLLLELVTGRRAIQESRNLVEWSQKFMVMDSRLPELVDPAITGSFDLEQLQTVVRIVRWCTQREGRARPSIKQVLRLLYERLDPVYTGFVQAVEDEDEGTDCGERSNRGKVQGSDVIFHSGDARCLQSSSSTSRSYCSRSFLLETGSPQSPPGIFSS